ncbi:YbaN family protein [Erysipelothrix urinaevulpis]|uniref:YbaN family protein n=1 Tax=Erysipelothrix urinaevulpis TaxID=2683717 RepID=UPI0022A684F5
MVTSLFFLVLGVVGVVIPVWPTTPFLLLSSLLAAKGSTRIHRRITQSNLYKNNLEDFVETRTMTKKSKIKILMLATVLMMFAFYFSGRWWARVIITLLVVVKYYTFLVLIKTCEEEECDD